jgi:hypothetical protein
MLLSLVEIITILEEAAASIMRGGKKVCKEEREHNQELCKN